MASLSLSLRACVSRGAAARAQRQARGISARFAGNVGRASLFASAGAILTARPSLAAPIMNSGAALPGVIGTRVGYTGGSSTNPSYNSVCRGDGHTEALKIVYDPSIIKYEDLLRIFWKEHNATVKSKAQYKSAVWPTTEAQMKAVLADKARLEEASGRKVATDIEMADVWWDAEEYHQKYIDKARGGQGAWSGYM